MNEGTQSTVHSKQWREERIIVSEGQESSSGRADYRELAVWKNGIMLAKHAYQVTSRYPSQESYGLVSHHRGEFSHFLQISLGSLAEIDTQLIISYELGFISKPDLQTFADEIFSLRRMLYGLIRSLSPR
jgi:hypothetical protein